MAQAPATIIAIKQDFLSAQTRLLSHPLAPSAAWRASLEEAGDFHRRRRQSQNSVDNHHEQDNNNEPPRPLPEKAIDDALFRLNHRLQQHAKRAFPPQANRHVAEQIDVLYREFVERRVAVAARGAGGGGGGGVGVGGGGDDDEDAATADADDAEGLLVGADLTNPSTIATLPASWDACAPPRTVEAHPLEAARYADLASRLQDLGTRRQDAAARVTRLRRVRALLDPFGGGGGGSGQDENGEGRGGGGGVVANVQPNLVTREGEIESQLERMRVLLARVGGRVAALERQDVGAGGGQQGLLRSLRGGEGRGAGGAVVPAATEDHADAMVVEDLEADERRKVGNLLDMF